jgi:putative cardiolipin synthase
MAAENVGNPRALKPCRAGVYFACLVVAQISGCAMSPAGDELPPTHALPAAEDGTLHDYAARIQSRLAPNESAFWLVDRADYSFDARLALVDSAVTSLDIQYFIWEKDASSWLFARRVIRAADRGVRVRILLDDLSISAHEKEFASLGMHPNIEVRTFNPFGNRTTAGRVLEFIFRFGRLNHRMHNKSVIADGRFAILGGRNIGNRYFGVYDEFVQNDLDIMSVGPVVDAVAAGFDVYWNSDQAFPLEVAAPRRSANGDLAEFTAYTEATYLAEKDRLQAFSLEPADWTEHFEDLVRGFAAGPGQYVQDPPDVNVEPPERFYVEFEKMVARTQRKLIISSPYFIPEEELVEQLAALVARGVRVVVLTNSLASNNHINAHTAYKRWRERLIEAGIELYEARADSSAIGYYTTPPTQPGFLGLHSKATVVDDTWCYVGSPNVDPRSMVLNTENGFFVESVDLAARVTELIERDIEPRNAWRVSLDAKGELQWTNDVATVTRQPAKGFTQRVVEFFINFMPIKNQA